MKTLGQSRVRVNFNPSEDEIVRAVKHDTAGLIDAVHAMQPIDEAVLKDPINYGEFLRYRNLAMTALEEASMWAVKARTLPYEQPFAQTSPVAEKPY